MINKKEKQDLLQLAAVLSSKQHQELAQQFAVSLSKDAARLLRLVAQVGEKPKTLLSFILPSTTEVIEDQVTFDPQPSSTPDPFSVFDEKEKEEEEKRAGRVLAWLNPRTGEVTGIRKKPNALYPGLNPLREKDFECVYALEVGDQFVLSSNMRRQYGKNWPHHIENATLLTYEEYVKKSAQRGC